MNMKKLDCVNTLLVSIGEMPITTLDAPMSADAVLAIHTIDNTILDVLSEGWHFNEDTDITLTPDVNGEIEIPENVIAVDTDVFKTNNRHVQIRSGHLYDNKKKTFIFDTPVTGVCMRFLFDYDDLPLSCKQYITAIANLRFQSMVLGDTTMTNLLLRDAERARLVAVADDIRQSDINFLDRKADSIMGFSNFHSVFRG